MQKNLPTFLYETAASLRDLALRAPDIANELRRLADDLDKEGERAARKGDSREDHAAE